MSQEQIEPEDAIPGKTQTSSISRMRVHHFRGSDPDNLHNDRNEGESRKIVSWDSNNQLCNDGKYKEHRIVIKK